MIQEVKPFATKPEDLSRIPKIHTVERTDRCKLPLTSVCAHTSIHVIKRFKKSLHMVEAYMASI